MPDVAIVHPWPDVRLRRVDTCQKILGERDFKGRQLGGFELGLEDAPGRSEREQRGLCLQRARDRRWLLGQVSTAELAARPSNVFDRWLDGPEGVLKE